MENFKPQYLKVKLVQLLKIKSNGEITYIKPNGEISKISSNLFQKFKKKYHVTNFETSPIKASILFYKNVPYGLEVAPFYAPSNFRDELIDNWVPNMVRNRRILKVALAKLKGEAKVLFDGRNVFYFARNKNFIKTRDTDIEFIKTHNVKSFSLYSMSLPYFGTEFSFSDDNSILQKVFLANRLTMSIKSNGKVYYSPIVADNFRSLRTSKKVYFTNQEGVEEYKYKHLISFKDLYLNYSLNLLYVSNLVKIIGDLYGYDAVDFLNFPSILISLNTNSLSKIPEHLLESIPVEKNIMGTFAWLLDLYYKEKNLYKKSIIGAQIRKLTSGTGICSKTVNSPYKKNANTDEHYSSKDIPLYSDYQLDSFYIQHHNPVKKEERKVYDF